MRKIFFVLFAAFLFAQFIQVGIAYANLDNQSAQSLDPLGDTLELILSAFGGLMLLGVTWVSKKYLIPLLATERKRRMAKYILLIADEVTDYFVSRYPDQKVLTWIDQAVDKIMEITGIEKEVAVRALQASLSRKKTLTQ